MEITMLSVRAPSGNWISASTRGASETLTAQFEGGAQAARRAARALTDEALLHAMADMSPVAWAEFEERFRPLLEQRALRFGIPTSDWPNCIDETIEDEGLKLARGQVPSPTSVAAWLVAAMRRRYLMIQRANRRREQYYRAAVVPEPTTGERVIASVHATSSRVAEPTSDGTRVRPLQRLAEIVAAELSHDERLLLAWSAEGVPQRLIAEWTGTRYETVRKRMQRLCGRLRSLARSSADSFPPGERRELERLFVENAPLTRGNSRERTDG